MTLSPSPSPAAFPSPYLPRWRGRACGTTALLSSCWALRQASSVLTPFCLTRLAPTCTPPSYRIPSISTLFPTLLLLLLLVIAELFKSVLVVFTSVRVTLAIRQPRYTVRMAHAIRLLLRDQLCNLTIHTLAPCNHLVRPLAQIFEHRVKLFVCTTERKRGSSGGGVQRWPPHGGDGGTWMEAGLGHVLGCA